MMYNQVELKAMQNIASKLNWHKPAYETVETITKMVKNQQALELDCYGECDGFEETLLSMNLWDVDKVESTLFINDYHSLINYYYTRFLEKMCITDDDYRVMLDYYINISSEAIVAENEAMEEFEVSDYDYQLEYYQENLWISNNC